MLHNVSKATNESSVLLGIETLKIRLHHIDWVVKHGRAKTCECTGEEITEDLPLNVVLEELLCVFKHYESNTLVGGLL
jgi:hypothetical protein